MRKVLATALCLIALPFPAHAQDLRGQWKITVPSIPSYSALALIDAERRAIFDDDLGPSWRGYVAHADSTKVEFVITGNGFVGRVFCTVQTADLLHCRTLRPDGAISGPSIMARTGPAPRQLTSDLR